MFKIRSSNRFKRDLKLVSKQGLDLNILNEVVTILCSGQTLKSQYKDHALTGSHIGFRECHIQPDWLLIYRIDYDNLCLFLARTGSHAELFS